MATGGQTSSRVVHFDATQLRKTRMRNKATAGARSAPTRAVPAATADDVGAPPEVTATRYVEPVPAQQLRAQQPPPEPPANGEPVVRRRKSAPPPEQLETFLINFVVEQTGYPTEIIDLDADLEADLGIDSIKKAQLFGELREYFEFDLSSAEDFTLDDFPTLRDVLRFLQESSPDSTTEPAAGAPVADSAPVESPLPVDVDGSASETVSGPSETPLVRAKSSAPPPEQLESFLINFVVEQTGYPPEIVEMDADLEADLGIDSIKKAQLFGELREYFEFDLSSAEDFTLDDFPTLRDILGFLQASRPEAEVPPEAQPQATHGNGQPATPAVALDPEARGVTVQPKSSAPAPEQLEPFLINFVVEQTGYPPEIVEMDADLEADLGIDSIKKAQLFGELREYFEFDLSSAEDFTLDDFPTLRDVLNFLQGTHPVSNSVGASPGPDPVPAPAIVAQPADNRKPVMDEASILATMQRIIIERNMANTTQASLTSDTRLIDDFGLDSVGMLDLITAVEQHFGITISLEDLEIETLNASGAFASLIQRKLADTESS